MRYIEKGEEPDEFTEWKGLENEDWKPSYDKISGPLKNQIKESLMKEQGYICCYCERSLVMDDSHIEHLKPQHREDVDPLKYSNMLCSCQKGLQKGEPLHCGNAKGQWYDNRLFIHPLLESCESSFRFLGDGSISPENNDDESAKATIDHLALDIEKLKDLRKTLIDSFVDENLTEDELEAYVNGYLRMDQDSYHEFPSMIKYLFKELVHNE